MAVEGGADVTAACLSPTKFKSCTYKLNPRKKLREHINGEVSPGSDFTSTITGNLRNVYAQDLRRFGSRAVFLELEALRGRLEDLTRTFPYNEDKSSFAELVTLTDWTIAAYEGFLQTASGSERETFRLVESGSDLFYALKLLTAFSRMAANKLDPHEPIPEVGYEELSLQLSSANHYREVLSKLSAIENLYSELCNLLGISTSEYPLKVIKLEAGSLWLRLFGESRVVRLIAELVERAAGYLYRTYTTEGKISSLPRQVESVEAVLKLSESLDQHGIDTADIKENARKSAVIISARLNELLQGSPTVIINKREFSVGDALTEKYLEESRTLLLQQDNQNPT